MNSEIRYSDGTKNEAIKRRRNGEPVTTIAKALGCTKGTVLRWTSAIVLSVQQRAKMQGNAVQARRLVRQSSDHNKSKQDIQEAEQVWARHLHEPLFNLGIGLYWGEGNKTGRTLALVNSDPFLLRVWIQWCRQYTKCPMRFRIAAHADVKRRSAMQFWRTSLKIKGSITYYVNEHSKASKKIHMHTRPMPHGTLTATVGRGSAEWHRKMMRFIELASR